MAVKQWTWNKFYGGQSDYPAMISDNDSAKYGVESFSVDGRKNPAGVQIGNFISVDGGTGPGNIINGDITCYIDLKDYFPTSPLSKQIVAVTKNGAVYMNSDSVPIYTFTTSAAKEIYAMSVMSNLGVKYLYFFSKYTISRCTINDSTLVLSAFQESYRTFIKSGDSIPKIYNNSNEIYFSSGNILKSINNLEVVTETELVLLDSYYISGITFFQDVFKIYGNSRSSGVMYAWSANEETTIPKYIVPYDGLPIMNVVGEAGMDYAVMGYDENNSDLYALAGTGRPQIMIVNTEGVTVKRKFNGVMAIRSGIIYLGGEAKGLNCLFSFGNYHKGFPQCLQVEGITGEITSIFPRNDYILFGNNVGGDTPNKSGIQFIGYPQYNATGEIVSLIFTGGKRSVKSMIDVEICFDGDSTNPYDSHGGKVTLYFRTKQSAVWTKVREFQTDYSSNPDGFVRISRVELGTMGNFNQIEYRMVLEKSGNGSPLITSVTTTYDDNIKGS